MSWLDALLDRGNEARREPAPPEKLSTQVAAEIKTVWFQTRTPRDGDQGAAEPGFYSVADGFVTMYDESGKPIGKQHILAPGEDARKVAGQLAKASWLKAAGRSDFNRPLHYRPPSIA